MIVETSDGRSVEVGVAGREDMIGFQLAGGLTELCRTIVRGRDSWGQVVVSGIRLLGGNVRILDLRAFAMRGGL